MTKPLIDAQTLHQQIKTGDPHSAPLILDCRFNLADPELGLKLFEESHIPTAYYADLNRDLSATHLPGKTGRHPLPTTSEFMETLQRWQVTPHRPIVCYDDSGGCFAARAWWLLRWAGFEAVSVLDGGFAAWRVQKLPAQSGPAQKSKALREIPHHKDSSHAPDLFFPHFREDMLINADQLLKTLFDPSPTSPALIDARAPDRYRGENETIDPIAGHIPTAICLPFADNLDDAGFFKPAEALRERFAAHASVNAVVYCGSGVTACHNILACAIAKLPWPRLYAGSWSEWITDPDRPIVSNKTVAETAR